MGLLEDVAGGSVISVEGDQFCSGKVTLEFENIANIDIKPWKMEKRFEKQAYLQARELAFGYPLGSVELLEHFSHSELWQGGTSFTAFADEGKIIASIMALSNGLLDYVFVIPGWPGSYHY